MKGSPLMTASDALSAGSGPSLQDLLGKSHSLPTWLDPERFLSSDFDPELAVLDLRRHVSASAVASFLTMSSQISSAHHLHRTGAPRDAPQ